MDAKAKKAAKKAAKAAEAAEAKALGLTVKQLRIKKREDAAKAKTSAGRNDALFGDLPLIQSSGVSKTVWTEVEDLLDNAALVGKTIKLRARVHKLRAQSQCTFFVLRHAGLTVQAVLSKGGGVTKAMLKFTEGISAESIVDVTGVVTAVAKPVTSTDIQNVEIALSTVHVMSRAGMVPYAVDAAMATAEEEEAEEAATGADAKKAAAAGDSGASGAGGGAGGGAGAGGEDTRVQAKVGSFLRYNYRWLDLRRGAHNAIMRVSSAVCQEFRTFLLAKGFMEMQTPKLIAGASEGGAEVFRTKYFGRDACLAQSPQLYKQMCAACSDFDRVFEIGPVFRAEDSNTNRHLCEFHGLDLEMVIKEHYYEVLDMFSELFIAVFDGIHSKCKKELELIRQVYPFKNLQYCRPSLKLTFEEGIALLKADGADADPEKDLSTPNEKRLGRIVKEKYGTDFYMMDRYPMAARPFYTMPAPDNPAVSNSYDFFVRGEEILSGAQRVHDSELLVKLAKSKGVPPATIQAYIDSFKLGSYPHGGGGIGLERLVMLMLGLPNIRLASMFPRDPRRIEP